MEEKELISILETPIEELKIKHSYIVKLVRAIETRRAKSPYEITDPEVRVKDAFKIGLDRLHGTLGLGPLAFNAFIDYLTGLGVDVERLSIDYHDLSGEPLKPLEKINVIKDLQLNGVNCLSDYPKPRFEMGSPDLDVIIQAFLEYLKILELRKVNTNNAHEAYNLEQQIAIEIATFEKIVGIKQLPQGNIYKPSTLDDLEKDMQEHEKRLSKFRTPKKEGSGGPKYE